jgi:hypothetical protein
VYPPPPPEKKSADAHDDVIEEDLPGMMQVSLSGNLSSVFVPRKMTPGFST